MNLTITKAGQTKTIGDEEYATYFAQGWVLTSLPSPVTLSAFGGDVVTTAQHRWRAEFNTFPNPNWVQTKTGTGIAASVSGGALAVVSGTTAGDTYEFVGNPVTRQVGVPSKVAFGYKASSKVVNHEVYLELVALNQDGTPDESCVASWRISGTDTTTAAVARREVNNGGATRVQTANDSLPTPVTSDSIFEIQIETDEVWFHQRPMDSSGIRSFSAVFQKTSPDPARSFVPRVRIRNGNTNTAGVFTPAAPTGSVTDTFYFITGNDYSDVLVELTGGSGDSVAGRATPVNVTNAPTVNASLNASAGAPGSGPARITTPAATTNPTLVAAGTRRLYGLDLFNNSASTRFFKLYNTATAPTPGTTPFYTIGIPAGGRHQATMAIPVAFGNGIGYTITALADETDTTPVGIGDIIGHLEMI